MEQMIENREAAVDEIMAALGMAKDDGEPDMPDTLETAIPLAENAGVMVLPAEEETNPAPQPEKPAEPQGNAVLCALNAAIRAIHALDKCMLGNSALYDALQNCADDLETVRHEKFGHLVDWEAIARSGGRNDRLDLRMVSEVILPARMEGLQKG